jgi:hypothetical protein
VDATYPLGVLAVAPEGFVEVQFTLARPTHMPTNSITVPTPA